MEKQILSAIRFISVLFTMYVIFLAIFCYRWNGLAGVATTIQLGAISCAIISTAIIYKAFTRW